MIFAFFKPIIRFEQKIVLMSFITLIITSSVKDHIEHHNNVRLNSAIGYIAPLAKLEGRDKQIFEDRD